MLRCAYSNFLLLLGGNMKYALSCLLLFLLFSCSDNPTGESNPCKNITCESYEECSNGICVVKDGFCAKNSDCFGNSYCDGTSHTCINTNNCDNIICESYEECSNGICVVKDGFCVKNSDCNQETEYCETETHECKTKVILSCEGITCINGHCVLLETGAVCECNDGYFNKTPFECLKDTCLNKNEIGTDEESATFLNSNREEIKCYGKQDVYKVNKKNIIVSISEGFTLTLYKTSITPENIVYDNEQIIFIENQNEETYYITANTNSHYDEEDYIIYYRENCSENTDCPDYLPVCSSGACILPCENNQCPGFAQCVNGKCEDKTCDSHFDCPGGFCMLNNKCGYTYQCSGEDGELSCEVLKTFEGDDFLCDRMSYDVSTCVPYKNITDSSFSITEEFFTNPNFAFWYKFTATQSAHHNITVTTNLNNNSLREKILFYQQFLAWDGHLYIYSQNATSVDSEGSYMPPGEYYIYLLPYYTCNGSNCREMSLTMNVDTTELESCANNDVCINEITDRSQCYDGSCIYSLSQNVSVGERCDLHENCIDFDLTYVKPACLVKPTGGVCSIECSTNSGCEYENINEYNYCVPIGEQGYCMKECLSDDDCLIGTFSGVCELNETSNVNLCRF